MTQEQLVWLLFRTLVAIGLGLLFICTVCMALYDIKAARSLRKTKAKANRFKPEVTILVPAYNEERVIKRCLEELKSLNYPCFNTVVVSDASTDSTSRIVRGFIKENPSMAVRLVNLRKNRGKGGALNYAIKRYCDTPLMMVLDADSIPHQDALTNAVRYFIDPKVMGLATNVRVAAEQTPLSYLQKIEYLVGYRHKKYFSLSNSEFIIGGLGSTYRTSIVKRIGAFDDRMLTEDIALSLSIASRGNKANRLVYGHDVLIYTEAVQNIKSLFRQRYRWKFGALQAMYKNRQLLLARSTKHSLWLTWLRIPQALIGEILLLVEPLFLSLFIVVAYMTKSPEIFLGSWFTLTAYILYTVFLDEYATRRDKLTMVLVTPVMYPLFYMLTIINVIAMGKCVKNWRKIVGLEPVRGTWISPERLGKQITSY